MDADLVQRRAEQHFGQADLKDKRRTRRLVKVAAALAAGGGGDNGGTITSVIRDPAQAKAAYRLLDRLEVTHQAVIGGHARRVLEATEAPGDYLLIEDTTTVAWSDPAGTRGMGPIGDHYTRGLWVHSTLVVKMDWASQQRQLLGLLGQQTWARPVERPAGRPRSGGRGKESGHARQSRDDRESQRWMASLVQADGPMSGTTWTFVADRESDIYELFLRSWLHGWNFVIRAAHRRALAGEWAGEDLFAAAAQGKVLGGIEVELPREGRTATLEVRSSALELRGPMRPGGRMENHDVNVVWAQETDPPAGKPAVHWVLLTDVPVETLDQCRKVLAVYASRWLIEEWHKALKTGLKVESSQLSDVRRLSVLVGILSIVAVFLLEQKLSARRDPQRPLANDEVDPAMLAVLTKLHPPKGPPTARWFHVSIARLGGFMARKGDGDPGWLTLWRGWQTLMLLIRGYELADSG